MAEQQPANHDSASTEIINQPEPKTPSWGCGKLAFLGMGGCIVIAVLLILLIPATVGSAISAFTSVLSPKPPQATIISSNTLLTNIQPMGQLTSISLQLAKADITVDVEQRGVLNNNFCSYWAKYVAQGTIKAGVDLGQISEADITYDTATETYTITLPQASLTSCSIDMIDQYQTTLSLCPGIDWDENRQLAQYVAQRDFQADAIEGGILTQAQEQAKGVLANFVGALTGKQVNITFDLTTTPTEDNTCEPIPPEGWVWSEETTNWSRP